MDLMDKFHLLRIDSEFTAALEDSHSCAFQFHPQIWTAKKLQACQLSREFEYCGFMS